MPLKTYSDELPVLNLTPMIDVVLQLIIFFMVGTRFAEIERSVPLDVPRVKQTSELAAAGPQRRSINVYGDGTITLDQQELTLEDLTHRLRQDAQQHPSVGVLVRGDATGPFQNVANVLTACRDAGIQEMGICVRLQTSRH